MRNDKIVIKILSLILFGLYYSGFGQVQSPHQYSKLDDYKNAQNLIKSKEFSQGIQILEDLLQDYDKEPNIMFWLAIAYSELGDWSNTYYYSRLAIEQKTNMREDYLSILLNKVVKWKEEEVFSFRVEFNEETETYSTDHIAYQARIRSQVNELYELIKQRH